MLVATLAVTNIIDTQKQLAQMASDIDAIELRLDYLKGKLETELLNELLEACSRPVIVTLRRADQGGYYVHCEKERLEDIFNLCALQPDYLDIEFDVPKEFIQKISLTYPRIKLILSYHNFNETPTDLLSLLVEMCQTKCYAYKIATYAQSSLDSLSMLQFIQAVSKEHRVIGICMGKLGGCTRILAPVVGSFLCYAAWDESQPTAPGQLSVNDLVVLYRYRSLNVETEIYALLGDPIDLSLGHILHNKVLKILDRNAVYVKLQVNKAELPVALSILRSLPFCGLSITMPLKEVICLFLDSMDEMAQKIGAVNTITCSNQNFFGTNTDGLGAVRALLKYVPQLSDRTVLLIGAGGAARSIVYALLQAGANVIITNRTFAKAQALAEQWNCEACALENLSDIFYEICINTLPESAYQDSVLYQILCSQSFRSNVIAMDIVYQPIETIFLKWAKTVDWKCIHGIWMYLYQAQLQLINWLKLSVDQLNQFQNIFESVIKDNDLTLDQYLKD